MKHWASRNGRIRLSLLEMMDYGLQGSSVAVRLEHTDPDTGALDAAQLLGTPDQWREIAERLISVSNAADRLAGVNKGIATMEQPAPEGERAAILRALRETLSTIHVLKQSPCPHGQYNWQGCIKCWIGEMNECLERIERGEHLNHTEN